MKGLFLWTFVKSDIIFFQDALVTVSDVILLISDSVLCQRWRLDMLTVYRIPYRHRMHGNVSSADLRRARAECSPQWKLLVEFLSICVFA